jgi:hypothetical protein
MSDFFARLELQLRTAAERPPRRLSGWTREARRAAAALVVVLVLAAAVVPVLLLLGGGADRTTAPSHSGQAPPPVGTVIPKGEGTPPRPADSTVVATGRAPLTGPWQLEVTRSTGLKDPKTGETYEPEGLPCLYIHPLDPPELTSPLSGQCGVFPRTPGFGRVQLDVPSAVRSPDGRARRVKEVLVYGRVPERAVAVVVTAAGGVRIEAKPEQGPKGVPGNFYVIPVKPGMRRARINWINRDGKEGSRGIELLPPASR